MELSNLEEIDMSKKGHSPNDMRSIVKNPQRPEFHADRSNRGAQGHPAPEAPAAPAVPAPGPSSGSEK